MRRHTLLFAGLAAMVLALIVLVRNWTEATPPALAPDSLGSQVVTTPPPSSPLRVATATTPHWLTQILGADAGLPRDEEVEESGRTHFGTLKGRLLWKTRRLPLTDVEIAMTRSWLDTVLPTILEDEPQDPVLLQRRVRTDERGYFSIFPVPTDGNLFFLIGRDTPFMDFRKVAKLPLPGQTVDLHDLYIEERGGLVGRVVTSNGMGVANVEIRAVDDPFLKDPLAGEELRRNRNLDAFDPRGMVMGEVIPAWLARRDQLLPFPQTRTGTDGRFSIAGLRPGQHVVFFRGVVQAAQRKVLIAGEQTTEMGDVRLGPAGSLAGRLEYEDKEPVVGAEIAAVSGDWGIGPTMVRTNARGEFRLFGLAPSASARILCRTRSGGPWQFLAIRTPELGFAKSERFVIERDKRALIHLVTEQGVPIAGARVRLMRTTRVFRREDLRLPASLQPTETAPGSWVARLGNWTGVRVVATADDHAPGVAVVAADAFEPQGMTLRMLSSFPIRFFVTDSAGNPVEGAEVLAAIQDAEWYQFPGSSWSQLSVNPVKLGTTDTDGVLEREGFWPTLMVFAGAHPDYATSPIRERVPAEGSTVQIRLLLPGRVEGRVTESREVPVRRWRILATPNNPRGHPLNRNPFLKPVTTITSPDGSFGFPHLHPGEWVLQPSLPAVPGSRGRRSLQGRARSSTVYAREGQVFYADLEVEDLARGGAPLSGEVALDGNPEPGLVVRLIRPEWGSSDQPRFRRPSEMLHSTLTDHGGRFQFFGFSRGTYLVAVETSHQGRGQRLARRVVDFWPKPENDHPPQIQIRTGSLQCTLLTDDGQLLSGRMVRIHQPSEDNSGAEFVVLSDPIGMIRLPGLPVGDYELALVGDTRKIIEPAFHIAADQFTYGDFVAQTPDRR